MFDSVAPEISVSGTVKTDYTVGDSIVLPAYSASDNVKIAKSVALVQDVMSGISSAEGNYRFKRAGTYYLIFFAQDEEGNSTKVIYELTVKGVEQ